MTDARSNGGGARRSTATRPALRVFAWLLTVLFSAGQLGSAAHFLTVRHGICPEHGELVHLDAGRAPNADVVHLAVDTRADPSLERTPGAGNIEPDEHCPTAATPRRDRAEPATRAGLAELAPPTESGRLAPTAAPDLGRTALLLFVAPKSSPPSFA